MVNTIRLCLVGAGSIGRRHLRLLLERSDTRLCVAEPNQSCADAVKEAFPQVPIYRDMEEAVRCEHCDAVIIATPHTVHTKLALQALSLGLHVFCEKPMSDSMDECVQLLQAAQKSDKVFSVGFMFRFDPFILKVKQIIQSGKLGNILHYSSRFATYNTLLCSVTKHQQSTPYSLVMDCIHDSDLLYFLTGKIPDFAYSSAYQAGDMPLTSPQNFIDTVYRWKDDPLGAHIHFNYVQHPQVHTLEIVGDKGYLQGDFMSAAVTVGSIDGSVETFPDLRGDFDNVYRNEWEQFLLAVRGERKAESDPSQAIVSTLLMHAQIESGTTGKEVDIHELAEKHGYFF